ncbi:TPA: hypothetical protein BOS_10232 [Bos taurus]|nr:TPA: hypothetical protein BOS_10232 [Bos taurus]
MICSMLDVTSSSSSLNSLFSFSSFCFTRCRLSICSLSSATLSACFLRRAAAVASCCSVASSRSRLIFWNSASRFLFISICTDVAPPASSSRSLISSSSRDRSERSFSTLARAVRSASSSSSSSSIRAWLLELLLQLTAQGLLIFNSRIEGIQFKVLPARKKGPLKVIQGLLVGLLQSFLLLGSDITNLETSMETSKAKGQDHTQSFIQGQFLTPMKARIFHWIISRESLQEPKSKATRSFCVLPRLPRLPLFPEPYSTRYPPLPEVPVEDAVGEALPADADALQHAVAAQLPAYDVVVHRAGVVDQGEVGFRLPLDVAWLLEVAGLAQVVVEQFGLEGHHEHVVVEELLQLLIGEVDAELLEAVELQGGDGEEWTLGSPLTSKISKPAMSRTPMKYWRGCLVSRVALIRVTIQLNILSYTALASAPLAYTTWKVGEKPE